MKGENYEKRSFVERHGESELASAVRRARGTNEPPLKPILLSAWGPCPLCRATPENFRLLTQGVVTPEITCIACGMSLRGSTVEALRQIWNEDRESNRVEFLDCPNCGITAFVISPKDDSQGFCFSENELLEVKWV